MKVGIITLPFEANYGWALQMWALYHTIKGLGHEPVIINRKWNTQDNRLTTRFKRSAYYNLICPRFKRFIDNEFHSVTKVVRTKDETYKETINFDAVITGSDQVWRIENTRLAGFDFFLDFVEDDAIKRISYAASFGKDTWQGTPEETQQVKSLLQRFDSISVREDSGVKLCAQIFGVKATHVLDPTLLLDSDEYNTLLNRPKARQELVTYILDSSIEKSSLIKSVAKKHRLSTVNLYPKSMYSFYKSVYTWLEKIRDAEYVIVDSFHGMAFSIIFSKQFVVLANEKRGLTRFTSLLDLLGLNERLTSSLDSTTINAILETPIDYVSVHKIIREARDGSLEFLKTSLQK